MEDYSKIIAKNLIELRKGRGLTQQDFAKILNYSDKTISKWELGYAIPSVDTLKQVADYYNVTVDYFLEPHEEIPYGSKDLKLISIKQRCILLILLVDLFFLSVAATIYAALATSDGYLSYWPIFLWGICLAAFFNGLMANNWWKHTILPYLFSSLSIWSALISLYFTLLMANVSYNFWYLFFVGLPIQLATIIVITLTHSTTKY